MKISIATLGAMRRHFCALGICSYPGYYSAKEWSAIVHAAQDQCGCLSERDDDIERHALGYTSERWDIGTVLTTRFAPVGAITRLPCDIQRIVDEPIVPQESMMHRIVAGSSMGIDWHTDRRVSIRPDTLRAIALIYPSAASTGDNGALEVQACSENESRSILVLPKPRALFVLHPDALHRVRPGALDRDRVSVVVRFASLV